MIQQPPHGEKTSTPCVVAFILALKANAVAQNWERVCRLCAAREAGNGKPHLSDCVGEIRGSPGPGWPGMSRSQSIASTFLIDSSASSG